MGNTTTSEYPTKEQCKTYYNLVMMQVREKDAYEASQKYPNDIDKAISYIASKKRQKLDSSQTSISNTSENKSNRFPKSTDKTKQVKTEMEQNIGKLLQILYSENTSNVWLCFEQNNTFIWYHTYLIYNPHKIGEICLKLPFNKIDIPLSLNYEIICVSNYLFCITNEKGYFMNMDYDITKYKQHKNEIMEILSTICDLKDNEIVDNILSYIYISNNENVSISMNINTNDMCDQTFNIYYKNEFYQYINFSEYQHTDFDDNILSKQWKEFKFNFDFNAIFIKIFNGQQLFQLFNIDSIENDEIIYYFFIFNSKTQIFYIYDHINNKTVHAIDLIQYEWPPPNIRSNPEIFMLGFYVDFDSKLIFILFADCTLQNTDNNNYDIFGCYINPSRKMLRNELIMPAFNTKSNISCNHICKSLDKQNINLWLSYTHSIHILTKFYQINGKTLRGNSLIQPGLTTQNPLTDIEIFMTDRKITMHIL